MEVCPNCGREIRSGDRYCLHCGQRLRASVPTWGQMAVAESGPRAEEYTQEDRVAHATAQNEHMRLNMSKPPRFTWKTSDGVEHDFDVTANEIAIGRAPTCDIVLADDQMVSRRHAVIRRQGSTCTLVDLGSSNGTLINGVEIHDATILKQLDRVTIGDHDLTFYEAADVPQPVGPSISQQATIVSSNGTAGPVPPSIWSPPPPVEQPAAYTPRSSFDIYTEQDTGSLGVVEQDSGTYTQSHNGKEVAQDSFSSTHQDQLTYSATYQGWQTPSAPTPMAQSPVSPDVQTQRQDAAALLATIKQLHEQLEAQVSQTDQSSSTLRSAIQGVLSQLDAALNAAHSVSQQQTIGDLRQLAENVDRSPLVDQVASLARRAGEIRDVLNAHQDLLNTLTRVRQSLEQIIYS